MNLNGAYLNPSSFPRLRAETDLHCCLLEENRNS